MKYFSIIIPYLKFDKELFNCLQSLNFQNYSNFEVILVYNGSKNIRKNQKENYLKTNYPNLSINLIVSKKKNNISYARNFGITNSRGKYLIFLDSDDMIFKNSLISIFREIKKNTPEVIAYNYKNIKKNKFSNDFNFKNKKNFLKNINDFDGISLTCWRFIVQKKFLIKNKIKFNTQLLVNEDNLFVSQIILNMKKFFISKLRYYIYNYNPKGMTARSMNVTRNINDIIYGSKINLVEFLKLYKKKGLSNKLKQEFLIFRLKDIFIKNFVFSNLKFQQKIKNKLINQISKKNFRDLNSILKNFFEIGPIDKIENIFFNNINNLIVKDKPIYLFSFTHNSSLISKYFKKKNIKYEVIDNSKIIQKKTINKKKIRNIEILNKIKEDKIIIICHTSNKIKKEIMTQLKKNINTSYSLYYFDDLFTFNA